MFAGYLSQHFSGSMLLDIPTSGTLYSYASNRLMTFQNRRQIGIPSLFHNSKIGIKIDIKCKISFIDRT